MVNVNECILEGKFVNKLKNIRMKEAITSKYKEEQGIEATFKRGSQPINGIFILGGLEIEKGGYFPKGYVTLDHCAL